MRLEPSIPIIPRAALTDRSARHNDPRAGTHYCLDTALAKIAVEESLRAVLAAAPPLRLTEDPAEIPWRPVLGRRPVRLLVSPDAAA
jgi:cytochrome P450